MGHQLPVLVAVVVEALLGKVLIMALVALAVVETEEEQMERAMESLEQRILAVAEVVVPMAMSAVLAVQES